MSKFKLMKIVETTDRVETIMCVTGGIGEIKSIVPKHL